MSERLVRRYCWRIGGPVEQKSGTKCMECGSPIERHGLIPVNECGYFTQCDYPCACAMENLVETHGHGCHLEPGHRGQHQAQCCAASDADRRLKASPESAL